MKDLFLSNFWTAAMLAKNALICEFYTIARNETGVFSYCGDCIWCWMLRKLLMLLIVVVLWLTAPSLGVAFAVIYGVAMTWEQLVALVKATSKK